MNRMDKDPGILADVHHTCSGKDDLFVDTAFTQVLETLQTCGYYRRLNVST